MELNEAIKHCEEKAKDLRQQSDFIQDQEEFDDCCECAREHEELAAWLTELQERRDADRWIPVSEKLPEPLIGVIATDNNDVFVAWYNEGWKSSDSQFDKHTPIVAWRPIPQYTESEKGGAV